MQKNVENRVVWGGYGSLKVIGNVTIQYRAYNFLSTLIETMHLSYTVFENVANYLSKVVNFNLSRFHLVPLLGVIPVEFHGNL